MVKLTLCLPLTLVTFGPGAYVIPVPSQNGKAETNIFPHPPCRNAKTGKQLKNFPMRLEGGIHSRPLLLPQTKDAHKGLLIIVTGTNGILYLIDPLTPAIERVDIGHYAYDTRAYASFLSFTSSFLHSAWEWYSLMICSATARLTSWWPQRRVV